MNVTAFVVGNGSFLYFGSLKFVLSVTHQRTVKVGQPPIQANERNHSHLSTRENPISLMLNLTLTTVLSAANV
jgi:hypothetical protein